MEELMNRLLQESALFKVFGKESTINSGFCIHNSIRSKVLHQSNPKKHQLATESAKGIRIFAQESCTVFSL